MMAIDDDPVRALEKQLEMENLAVSPVTKAVITISSSFPLSWPFDKVIGRIKDRFSADSLERIRLLIQTLTDEIRKHEVDLKALQEQSQEQELRIREEVSRDLLIDASRKAEATRSRERIKRIGLILANGLVEKNSVDGDEIEEMMRIAMELSDRDVDFLGELLRIEGATLKDRDHIPRYDAHLKWEQGRWGSRIDPEIDSVFSKLEGYGLVARLAPPNNQNITADYQNRYVLLRKGSRFSQLVKVAPDLTPVP